VDKSKRDHKINQQPIPSCLLLFLQYCVVRRILSRKKQLRDIKNKLRIDVERIVTFLGLSIDFKVSCS